MQKGGGDYTLADDYRDLCKNGSLFACMWKVAQAKKKAKTDKKKGKGAKKGNKVKG